MEKRPVTFALFFGNRGFMPAELIAGARRDMIKAVTDAGYGYLAMDEKATRYGAVETRDEGRLYHDWLKSHEGEYDGVILCMPIFIDENGAVTALQDAGVPILMQAFPDEIGKMDFAHRRDAFCGKFSVTDVFYQYKIPFTVMKPHVVHPLTPAFQQNLTDFAAICRVVGGMKRFNLGCLGARTTAFKTVRFDEVTLQRYGINVESFDLSELVYKVNQKADDDAAVIAKIDRLENYTDFSRVSIPWSTRYSSAAVSTASVVVRFSVQMQGSTQPRSPAVLYMALTSLTSRMTLMDCFLLRSSPRYSSGRCRKPLPVPPAYGPRPQ